VLGLLKQHVRKPPAVLGHGFTSLAEVLRVYDEAGIARTFSFPNAVAMAHAATAVRWQYGETAAVVTSIGPDALQAFTALLTAAPNGIGANRHDGGESTHDAGPNLQATAIVRGHSRPGLTVAAQGSPSPARRAAPRGALGARSRNARHPARPG
jgi:3D-(3,5/4)-trihydroxycyclohexane-1,2-dione acylhydrolase (decyclizing)